MYIYVEGARGGLSCNSNSGLSNRFGHPGSKALGRGWSCACRGVTWFLEHQSASSKLNLYNLFGLLHLLHCSKHVTCVTMELSCYSKNIYIWIVQFFGNEKNLLQ